MTRRTTLSALMLVLFLLVPSPAVAKGPSQVEVRNLSTGSTTMLTWESPELAALTELVEWPSERRKPRLVANGGLTHVATLAWQFEDGHSVWLDRVFSDGKGTTWIARRDHLSGNAFVTWGRVRAPFALEQLLAGLGDVPARVETTATIQTPKASTTEVHASRGGFDGVSFGSGAAAAALLAGSLGLLLRRRRAGLA
jgi:hypothetical protein